MSRSIFISRDLPENDKLILGLAYAGFSITAHSLIDIRPVHFEIPPVNFDWIFLASSNAAKIFLKKYNGKAKIAVAGAATAAIVKDHGFSPEFIGTSGDMVYVGVQFAELVKESVVLFPMAETSSRKIRAQLNSSQIIELIIYKSTPRSDSEIPFTEFVFLSSPSNAKVFLERSSVKDKTIIAIGETTKELLENHGVKDVLSPPTPSSDSILSLVLAL